MTLDPELLKILACPVCKSELGAVLSAEPVLVCRKCGRRYPVKDGIPDMIPQA